MQIKYSLSEVLQTESLSGFRLFENFLSFKIFIIYIMAT